MLFSILPGRTGKAYGLSLIHILTETLEQNIGVENLVEYRGDNSYISDIVETDEIMPQEQTTGDNPLYVYETHTSSNDTYLLSLIHI